MSNDTLSYRVRQALNMTTTEAGQLVHVTRRTWEMWESGKVTMPPAKRELFIAKLEGKLLSERYDTVIVVADDGITPIDAVSSDNFLDLEQTDDGAYVISSLAIGRKNGRPYVHRRRFRSEHNEHVLRKARIWESVREKSDDLRAKPIRAVSVESGFGMFKLNPTGQVRRLASFDPAQILAKNHAKRDEQL